MLRVEGFLRSPARRVIGRCGLLLPLLTPNGVFVVVMVMGGGGAAVKLLKLPPPHPPPLRLPPRSAGLWNEASQPPG